MSLPGGKQCKETLLRKASESAAHVAGFGLHLEGCGPPNLPDGFFDSLTSLCIKSWYLLWKTRQDYSGIFVSFAHLKDMFKRISCEHIKAREARSNAERI